MESSAERNLFNIKRDPKPYTYITMIDLYRHKIYSHLSIVIVLLILYGTVHHAVQSLMYWIGHLSFVIGGMLLVMIGIYLHKVIGSWDRSIKKGLLKFWNICAQLSMKNYRLTREYREIYQYHYNDVMKQCNADSGTFGYRNASPGTLGYRNASPGTETQSTEQHDNDMKSYVDFVLKNDPENKIDTYECIKNTISRIHQYIQLSYYLSFLNPCDDLDIKRNVIYINIKTESIMNKRNRKLESILNSIPNNYKQELVSAWSGTDRNQSDKILTIIPCKWIMYEYRNLFRRLHCIKYLKNVYMSFEQDYGAIENMVFELCSTIQDMFRRDVIYLPGAFIGLFDALSELFIFVIDNLVAVNIVFCFFQTGALLFPVLMSGIFHVSVICMVSGVTDMILEIKDPLKRCTDLENIDNRIENIFCEMKAILMDGKVKNCL
jgi:hypothetical protein